MRRRFSLRFPKAQSPQALGAGGSELNSDAINQMRLFEYLVWGSDGPLVDLYDHPKGQELGLFTEEIIRYCLPVHLYLLKMT